MKVVERDYGEKPEKRVATFVDTDLDEGLMNKEADEILKKFKLPLPSKLKNLKREDIKSYQLSADAHLNKYGSLLPPTRAVLYVEEGVNKAKNINKEAVPEKFRRTKIYNTLEQYISNLKSLEKYAKRTGQGIIHFNNPLQLINRLELLAGSIFAGNNGVKQEFSQIAHLLHQLKVITKKQLNDLLKKYILNK